MFWVIVRYNKAEMKERYSVVKSEYMPEFRFDEAEVYEGPFDTWGDAVIARDSANILANRVS